VSFNACGLSRSALTDIANFLELDTPWDFVMLQEVSSEIAFGPLAADRIGRRNENWPEERELEFWVGRELQGFDVRVD
jgi:hypothetical protein